MCTYVDLVLSSAATNEDELLYLVAEMYCIRKGILVTKLI